VTFLKWYRCVRKVLFSYLQNVLEFLASANWKTSDNSFPFSVCLCVRCRRPTGVFSTALSDCFFELALVRFVIVIYLRSIGIVLVCVLQEYHKRQIDCESKMEINYLRTGAAATVASETSAAPAWINFLLLSNLNLIMDRYFLGFRVILRVILR
jgi:hypothetical protein